VFELVCDSRRAQAAGWQPVVSLDDGLRRTWEYVTRDPAALRTAAFRA